MTNSSIRSRLDPNRQVTVPLLRWRSDASVPSQDELAVEEPLELRVAAVDGTEASLAAIMRTPGHDEELAVGFLFSEGLLAGRAELAGLRSGTDADGLPSDNVVVITSGAGIDLVKRAQETGYSRLFAVNSSCGICGKNTVAAACAAIPPLSADDGLTAPVPVQTLYTLPDQLQANQRVFASTGGLHAAALFTTSGALMAVREDIGRHNAVDKLIGRAFLDGTLPLRDSILLVSGRMSFEIVLKALAAGIPLLAAVSAPSSLAVDLAAASGITIAGFLRGDNVNVYTHPERISR
jgi:FdhD protein